MLAAALRAGLLLCDVPTPALLLDHSTAALWRGLSPEALDAALNMPAPPAGEDDPLEDLVYLHTAVTSGRDASAGAGTKSKKERHA